MKRKITSILLCLSIIAAFIPAAMADTAPIVIPDLIITNNDGTITAEYSGESGGEGDLLILAEYGLSGALKSMQTTDAVKGATVTTTKQNGRIYKAFAMNLNTMVPLCESAFYGEDAYEGSVEVPYIEGAVAEATTTAIREYADARLLVDELLELDLDAVEGDSAKLNEYLAKVDDAITAYDDVMKSAAVLYSVAEKSAETQNTELASMEDADISLMATNAEQLHWAEEISKKYDAIKGAEKLKQLGAMLGCDAREAYEQLKAAQDILRGKYMKDAESATRWIKGLTVVKTGCKVGLVIGATVATAGAGGATVMGATGLLVSTADATVDVGKTTATVIFGDEDKTVKMLEEKTKIVSDTAFVFSILTFNTASIGEKIACLGDVKLWAEDKMGCTTEELAFKMSGGKLMMDILTQGVTKENFEKLLNDTSFIDNSSHQKLLKATDLFNDGRNEITFDTLIDILDKGNVIEKGSEQDEYDALFDSFEEVAKEELDEKRAEASTDEITYHDNMENAGVKYYTNKNGDFVGRFERYSYSVKNKCMSLQEVSYYDDNGKLEYRTTYDIDTGTELTAGRTISYESFTDGTEPGSIQTIIKYFYSDEDVSHYEKAEIGGMKSVEEWIYYLDENGTSRKNRYYGNWYRYFRDGGSEYEEYIYGDGEKWSYTLGYCKSADKNNIYYRIDNNQDGTHTITYYYIDGLSWSNYWTGFSPIGHEMSVSVCKNDSNDVQSRYIDSDSMISGQAWRLVRNYEYEYDPETEKAVAYYIVDGYNYYPNSTHTDPVYNTGGGDDGGYEFQEIERKGPFSFD